MNLLGKRFGYLTVLSRAENDKWNHGQWECLCDCGKKTIVRTWSLTSGEIVSCGCFGKQQLPIYNKKYNQYKLLDGYGIGYTNNQDSYGRNEFYFDLEDYNKIKDYCWYFDNEDYVRTYITKDNERECVFLHQLILYTDKDSVADHIHGENTRNDNRRNNLRIASRSQNGMNRNLMSNNTSGITGVYFHKATQKWQATITINKQRIYLGIFDNFNDAVKVRKEAEMKYFGEYSYDYSQTI